MSSGRPKLGFTLVELMIAGGIVVVLLACLALLFVNVSQAYSLTERLADQQQKEDIAVNLLSYDLALAGYRIDLKTQDFEGYFGTADTLEITKTASGSDRILVRYLEDRFSGEQSAVPTVIEYQADKVAGIHNLYRCERRCQGANKQPAVEGVRRLVADAFILRNGSSLRIVSGGSVPVGACDTCVAAIRLQLAFDHAVTREVVIAFNNVQRLRVH